MHERSNWLAAAWVLIAACVLGIPVRAQTPAVEYAFEPVIGMPGKDVVWVPTPPPVVEFMLDVAQLTPRDFVIDLGSGDGRIVLAAAKRGARGLGVELNADMVQLSNDEAARLGLSKRAEFVVKDMFQTDLAPASVLTTYLLPHLNVKVRPQLLAQMKPGSRVLTYAFHMGEWQPDAVLQVNGLTVHLWIVPARAMGLWRWDHDGIGFTRHYEMNVRQSFQLITGSASSKTSFAYLRDMKLEGDRISFTLTEEAGSALAQTRYEGRIEGDAIVGTARTNNQDVVRRWSATRVAGRTDIEQRK
ncbi:MAG: class I SAM-dependent methyltransferase [Burkholderiales bacterium]|nr:class I SAM-dependent methyltransferase [Burkholderiales bacterium]